VPANQPASGTAASGGSVYRAVTRNIEVNVVPHYLADRSDPDESRYFWAYQVTIDNQSDEFVKLLSRYWHITDGAGRVEEVRGPGVVGEQPELNPGDSYNYTSGCPLSTPSGIMVGSYRMRNGRGEEFDIDIPAFSLDIPTASRTVN
jgi:ApaG protein